MDGCAAFGRGRAFVEGVLNQLNQNVKRATMTPLRGCASWLVLENAVLMYPKPPVSSPFLLVTGVVGLVAAGLFKYVRFRKFENSTRRLRLMRSLIRQVRPRLMFSLGWRAYRKSL